MARRRLYIRINGGKDKVYCEGLQSKKNAYAWIVKQHKREWKGTEYTEQEYQKEYKRREALKEHIKRNPPPPQRNWNTGKYSAVSNPSCKTEASKAAQCKQNIDNYCMGFLALVLWPVTLVLGTAAIISACKDEK